MSLLIFSFSYLSCEIKLLVLFIEIGVRLTFFQWFEKKRNHQLEVYFCTGKAEAYDT